jgi:hypothetical protein
MTPESAIKKAILDYLTARHIFALRMQSGVSFAEYKGKKRAIRYGVAGMSDILAFPKRCFWPCTMPLSSQLWIEVKTATGKQSELQKSFQKQVEEQGHRYIVARCIEDVEAAL